MKVDLRDHFAMCASVCITPLTTLNAWTKLYETWYVYHATWAYLDSALLKSLSSVKQHWTLSDFWDKTLILLECLHQSSWYWVCISCHLRPPQRNTSQMAFIFFWNEMISVFALDSCLTRKTLLTHVRSRELQRNVYCFPVNGRILFFHSLSRDRSANLILSVQADCSSRRSSSSLKAKFSGWAHDSE
jgi:hypothetical protein